MKLPSQSSANMPVERSFLLLRTEHLASVNAMGHDEIAAALHALADSSPGDFTIDKATALCEQAMTFMGRPKTTQNATWGGGSHKSEREADAYDEYFPVTRVEGNPRHIFAWSLLSAFRDLLIEAKTGTSLTPVEWSVIRQGFVELALLITDKTERYHGS